MVKKKKKIARSFAIIYAVLQLLLLSFYRSSLSGCTGKIMSQKETAEVSNSWLNEEDNKCIYMGKMAMDL